MNNILRFLSIILFSTATAMLPLIPSNAATFSEDLLNWKIRSVLIESTNSYVCYYTFAASNFFMSFTYDDDVNEFGIMVVTPNFTQLGIPLGPQHNYTVEFDGQQMDNVLVTHIQPGFIYLLFPDKNLIQPNITDSSSIILKFNLGGGLVLTFPIAPNYNAALAKAAECYTNPVFDDDATIDLTPPFDPKIPTTQSKLTLQDIHYRAIQTISSFPIILPTNDSTQSFFSYIMGNLESAYTVTANSNTISFRDDNLIGLFMISKPGAEITSERLLSAYKSRLPTGTCTTVNASLLKENDDGFLLNYISLCTELSENYFSIGYLLYTAKTKQIVEFNTLSYHDKFPFNLENLDTLRITLENFIKGDLGKAY